MNLTRTVIAAAFCILALVRNEAIGQSHESGVAAGQAANNVVRNLLNKPSASAVVPGYTDTPPETAYVASPNLGADASAKVVACAATPNDQTCQAILAARASAATPRPPVLSTDPGVAGARVITLDPASQGVGLAGFYSACTARSVLQSQATFDTQSCYQYLLRTVGNGCNKNLIVTVNWQCPAAAVSGSDRVVDPATGGVSWTCQVPQPRMETYCVPPLAGPSLAASGPLVGQVVCTDPLGVQSPAPSRQVMENFCIPPLMGPTLADSGPLAGQQVCQDSIGDQSVSPTRPVIDQVSIAATPVVSEGWANGCAGFEARVPPGYLPPDGDNAAPASLPPLTGPLEKCERTNSICTAPDETRVINDYPIKRACWQYSNTFDCLTLDERSDCAQPRFGTCAVAGAPSCIENDASVNPAVCTAYRTDFSCEVSPAVYRTVEDCGAQRFCTGGACFDTAYPPDPDFARSVAMLEATREAAKYMDPATLRLFRGFGNRCVKKLFGLVNCCNRGGSSATSLFSNYSIASAAVPAVGKAAISTYTYDALFTSDAPTFILSGFEALWGTGYSSGLAGVLAGDISVSSFVGNIVPGWWTLAILAIQASGIMSCKEAEQVTAMKRDASLCVELGGFCSRRLPLIGTCLEQTQSFCCFNSRLARIVNQQGLSQFGRGLGSARNPDCSGFSVAELQALDFSAMDLSEFNAEISPTAPNLGALSGAAAAKVPACYFGNGRC